MQYLAVVGIDKFLVIGPDERHLWLGFDLGKLYIVVIFIFKNIVHIWSVTWTFEMYKSINRKEQVNCHCFLKCTYLKELLLCNQPTKIFADKENGDLVHNELKELLVYLNCKYASSHGLK